MDASDYPPTFSGVRVIPSMVLFADLLQLLVGASSKIQSICKQPSLPKNIVRDPFCSVVAFGVTRGKAAVSRFSIKHHGGWD